MDKHIPTTQLQEAQPLPELFYWDEQAVAAEKTTEEPTAKSCCGTTKDQQDKDSQHHKDVAGISENTAGKYCPMHCEGEKVYDELGIVPFAECIW
jgi:Cu2+-exporting ATPase